MSKDSFEEEDFSDTDERLPYSHRTYDDRSPVSFSPDLHIKAPPDLPQTFTNVSNSPKASPRRDSDLPERLNFLKQLAENRANLQRQELEHKEMMKCTFSPEINDSSPRRTFNQFMESQNRFEKAKKNKLEMMREKRQEKASELEQESLSRIELSEGTKAILSQRSGNRPVYERLYSPVRKPSPQSPEHSYRPSLSPKSKLLKREENISELLYKDAVRRMKKPALTPSPSHRAAVNIRSEELLADVIVREVEGAWAELELKSKATYLDVGKLLAEMKFVTGSERELLEEAWSVMKGRELGYICKQTFINFLFAINNIKAPGRSVESEDTEESEMTIVTPQDGKTLRWKFASMLDNKKRAHFKPKQTHPEYTFKPSISPGSRKLAEKKLSDETKTARKKSEDASYLKPPIPRSDPVHNKTPSPVSGLPVAGRKPSESKQEKSTPEMALKISNRSKTDPKPKLQRPKGWEKSVERMRKAISKANTFQEEAEKLRIGRKADTPKGKQAETRAFDGPEQEEEMMRMMPTSEASLVEPQEAEEPIIVVNVTLPSGDLAQFTLYEDDEYEERVREFVQHNDLAEEDGLKLLATLRQHVMKS